MTTIGTLFQGFGGVDIGAQAAGIEHAWGLEYAADIAGVAAANGFSAVVADILDVNPRDFKYVDVLHASPPCPNFSNAKRDRGETTHDIAMADAVVEFIRVIQPRVFTLENVIGYRNAVGFANILAVLNELGYLYDVAHINAADFGVPQTRRRLWVRAMRGGLIPSLPPAEPWVGWYQAIEDLIPGLPESKFAPWQLARLPEELKVELYGAGGYNGNIVSAGIDAPAFTVTANTNQGSQLRAFLVGGANTSRAQAAPGVGVSDFDEPSRVVNASNAIAWRAFIVDDQNNGNPDRNGERGLTIRGSVSPMFTVSATQTRCSIRTYLLPSSGHTKDGGGASREDAAPSPTIRSTQGQMRSWLTDGRVVAMTPRCLARFQSFPDWYELPDKNALACRGIGNAVPPLLYEKLIRQFIGYVL